MQSREEHRFVTLHQSLWPASSAKGDLDAGLSFEVQLPYEQDKCDCEHHGLPLPLSPSCELPTMDPSGIAIGYKFTIHGHRDGLLKRDDK